MESLPGERKDMRRAGREIYSDYFVPADGRPKYWPPPGRNSRVRYRIIVTILNPARPYTLDILVIKERREKRGEDFGDKGGDPAMAQYIGAQLTKALDKSFKSRNVIDDFRAF